MNVIKGDGGWIEVICGSMFSGKSEELIRRLRRAQIAKQKVQVFKPLIDNRYDEAYVISHSKQKIECVPIGEIKEIYEHLNDETQVVGIDEAQFFDDNIIEIVNELANKGRRVIVAGLDQDYRGRPFGPIPKLLAVAEYITKTMAVCMQCGAPANRTQRLVNRKEQILVGNGSLYEPRCRKCYEPPEK